MFIVRLILSCAVFMAVFTELLTMNNLFAEELLIPEDHPYEVNEMLKISDTLKCNECHEDNAGTALKPLDSFNHSDDFISRHRFYASQTDSLCRSCHRVSFCTDCHGDKDELLPSVKHSDFPNRWLPHRGDYLFQHRIDGRIEPSKCFRCHGRQHNRSCKRCHK